ncbi:MAG TPA: carboxypeptidase-like regulatory domain-containing protein [Gemmatimonadales bacterium]|jgi:hypothetical protein|nr:carboxypeptidase-like regulatory domain-containing protein [Gemmatimonadales bacterium]
MFAAVATAVLLVQQPTPPLDTSAAIRGTASSTFNGKPLAGVMISIPAAHKFVVSDSTGAFRLDALPVGPQRLRVSYSGRDTQDEMVTLRAHHETHLVVMIDAEAVDLAPVVVEAQHPNGWRDLAGFYARKDRYADMAYFFTREEIDRQHPAAISALLARDGIVMRCGGQCLPVKVFRGQTCVVPVSVDGVPFREDNFDQIAVHDVAAVEIYHVAPPSGLGNGQATTAAHSAWRGGPVNPAGGCGAVLIWTR